MYSKRTLSTSNNSTKPSFSITCSGALVAISASHPLDVVRTSLQVGKELPSRPTDYFKGIRPALTNGILKKGVQAFLMQGISHQLKEQKFSPEHSNLIAAGAAASYSMLIPNYLYTVQTVQTLGKNTEPLLSFASYSKYCRQHLAPIGAVSFGYHMSFNLLMFGGKDLCNKQFPNLNSYEKIGANILLGSVTGAITNPLNTTMKLFQLDTNKNLGTAIQEAIKKQGVLGFASTGIVANSARYAVYTPVFFLWTELNKSN